MIGIGLIIFGALILVASLKSVYSLFALLPTSSLRHYWQAMMLLIVIFIVGYLGYATFFWEHNLGNNLHDLLVPAIFFLGSCFVWMTGTLSLRTAIDLRRMALLEEESITDPLLGIYNRRYLDRRLPNEINRARRYAMPLSILMVDIDHFKDINDAHGHQAGDLVLSYVGKLVLDAIRQSDIAARYGGEEIVIIAPETGEQTAGELAERLRKNINTHELVLTSESGSRLGVQVSVSIGVAGLDEKATTAKQLIENADGALYRAKESGRNRVVSYHAMG